MREMRTYSFLVLEEALATLLLVEVLKVSRAEGEHRVDVRLVLHRKVQSSARNNFT